MEKLDYWRLCDELTVVQAALLIAGADPDLADYVMKWGMHKRPKHFNAALTALAHAIKGDRLPANLHIAKQNFDQGVNDIVIMKEIDPERTTIFVSDLKNWLISRGFTSGFFFPQTAGTPDFLDSNHPHFTPKLAAAICAWQAVSSDPTLIKGKTVKQALLKWLRENADRFGLTKDDNSSLNELGIEEVAKIANWDTKGGSPKTPQ